MPGVDNNSSTTIDGNANDVATFNLSNSAGIVLGMSNSTNNGVTNNGAANGLLSVGAVANLSAAVYTVTLSASSAAVTPPGILQLNGAYSGSTASLVTNTLLSATGGDIFIDRGTSFLMDVNLGINGGFMTTSTGRTITLTSNLGESSGGAKGFTKNGDGTLTFSGANTYKGVTTIDAGIVNINGNSSAATGNVLVNSTGLLGGTGTVGGAVSVNSGGSIRGGATTSTATLTTASVTVNNSGQLFTNLAGNSTSSKLSLGANTLDLKTGSILKLDDVTGYGPANGHTWNIADLTSGTTLQLDSVGVVNGFVFGTYTQGLGNTGPVQIDVALLPALATGDQLILTRSGNSLLLTFTNVPEPTMLFGVAAALTVVGAVIRKRFPAAA
jgi:autotransporter-associated beta strand protein